MYKFNTNDFLVKIPLFIIFFWFGFLKIINPISSTRACDGHGILDAFLDAATWTIIIGIWEVFIAIFFYLREQP